MDKYTVALILIIVLLFAILDAVKKLSDTIKSNNIDQDISVSDINPKIDSIQKYLDDIILQLRKINYRLEHIAKDYDPSDDHERIDEEQDEDVAMP